MKPKTYAKGKQVGERILSGMDAFKTVSVPGAGPKVHQREVDDHRNVHVEGTRREYDDVAEQRQRMDLV